MILVKFNEDFLHMDVLCVTRFLNFTLAGIGSNLFVYLNKTLLLSEPIFVGERIHSINIKNDLVLLKGGRQLSLVRLEEISGRLECKIISKIHSSDWIQVVILFENQLAGLVTAHNFFQYWDLEKEKQLSACPHKEKCILYSCNIIGESVENLVVFAGTVFGDVLIWSPAFKDEPTLQKLKGHNGAVFSLEIKPSEKLLATTSDDRSLKIWSVDTQHPLVHPYNWKNSTIHLIHTLFGHTARVWRSLILPDCYLTISEDSQLIVWNRQGDVMKSISLHQESGIRGLNYLEKDNLITTGGEDGGINAFSLTYLLGGYDGLTVLNTGQSISTKVCFTKTGVIYTLKGRCIMVADGGEEEIYKNENFSSYCVLEVSFGGDYIIMGSIGGHLVVIDTRTKVVLAEEQILEGRIYSVHWLGKYILTCGPAGRLDLWQLLNGILKNAARMTLPNCKERWTTCAAIQNDKLIVGDRMGNVQVYKLQEGENPLKSFRKIHSYLGVTDVKTTESGFLSIGRDGTVKKYTDDLTLSITYKLPMEWPWKIVRHGDDILILGFHSAFFIVWSMNDREIIASHECGGGHRSCDFRLNKSKLSFLYVKEKRVYVADLPIDALTRIRNGFHGKEITCLKILQNMPTVIVTGSEDTTLRISRIEKSELKSIEVLKTHVSSIRAICTCPTDTGQLIVSVGGKGQIVVLDFDMKTQKCREVVNHRLRKETRNWKTPTPAVDPETRIMCADIVRTGNEFLVAAGCSDCRVRIFSFNESLNVLSEIQFSHCILNVTVLEVGLMRILVSMGTDGRVAFWDLTDCTGASQLAVFSIHQSGINSFQFEEIGNGKYIFVTGGDDNLISVAAVGFEGREVNLRRVWESRTAHSCQITGIKILKNILLTTSIDQRVTVWKWSHQSVGEFKAQFLNQYLTAVPDIQGMDAVWLNDSAILLAVHGKGLQVLKIDIDASVINQAVHFDKNNTNVKIFTRE